MLVYADFKFLCNDLSFASEGSSEGKSFIINVFVNPAAMFFSSKNLIEKINFGENYRTAKQ